MKTWFLTFSLLALTSPMAWGTPTIKCIHKKGNISSTWEVDAGNRSLTINKDGWSWSVMGDADFDPMAVFENSDLSDIAQADFYSVQREEGDQLELSVSIGNIVKGVLQNIRTEHWNFGTAGRGPLRLSPQTLGPLTCQVQQ
jgi:hypothetical protein